ncbi:GerAB/ArcD/ProY family transporter [Niallia oryzisoli]|uniref:GerAB/ArcD/ProY family transporter n=1 Tax=Niallia oryzisoli TaxID=1737571 RepID=UPI00373515D2
MKAKGTLRAREFSAIVLFCIGIKLSDTNPVIYAQTGKNAFWIMPIISFLVICPSALVLLFLLNKHQNKNLIELVRHIIGNKVGSLFAFVFFFITFSALSIDSRNYVETLNTMYYEESPLLSLYFVFMIICAFGAKKGFETIGSVSWSVLPYIEASLLSFGLICLQEVVWQRIFPIFGPGLKVLLMEGAKKGAIFWDLFILTIAYPVLKDQKSFHNGFLFGGVFSLIKITVIFFIYCTFFDYKSIERVAFPFHEITQYVSLGMFFTHVETYFMTFWVLAALLRFMIYLYVASWLLGETFRLKEFEPLILILGFLSITVGMIPEGPIFETMAIKGEFLNVLTPFFIIFPLLLWVVDKIKDRLIKDEIF